MTIGDEKVRRYEPRMIGIEDRPYEAGMYVSLHGHYVLHSAYAELAAVPAGYDEDEIADACIMAEVSDSKYEAIITYLGDNRRRAAARKGE